MTLVFEAETSEPVPGLLMKLGLAPHYEVRRSDLAALCRC
jgi:hypothetical protein